MVFVKGQSGNPAGKPRGASLRARIRSKALEIYEGEGTDKPVSYQEATAEAIYRAAIEDRDSGCMKLIVESIDGKLPLTIQHTTDDPRKMELGQIGEVIEHLARRQLPDGNTIEAEFTVREEIQDGMDSHGGNVEPDTHPGTELH